MRQVMRDWTLSDIWDAYVAGATDLHNNPTTPATMFNKCADAYVKLIYERAAEAEEETK